MAKTVNYLSNSHPLTMKIISFRLRKYADKGLKNYYIISWKTSITNGKKTYKKQLYNQQEINQL